MWYGDFYIADCVEQFTCLNIEDKIDIEKGAYSLESKIALEMNAISELPFFRAVRKLVLLPGELHGSCTPYFEGCPAMELKIDYYADVVDNYTIDISAMQQLRFIFSRSLYGFRNAHHSKHLKAIKIGEWYEQDFHYMEGTNIEAIQLLTGKIRNMAGIQYLNNLRFLSIANCPRIRDFAELGKCSRLESLVLENCGSNIVETMPAIPSLKYLNIRTPSIPDTMWFCRFPNLKYLILDAKIEDGRIDAFQNLKHCVLITNRRHYSMQNKDLPKSGILLPHESYHYELVE